MSHSKLNRALDIGLEMPISQAGLKWIREQDPELYKQIMAYKKKRGTMPLAVEEGSSNGD